MQHALALFEPRHDRTGATAIQHTVSRTSHVSTQSAEDATEMERVARHAAEDVAAEMERVNRHAAETVAHLTDVAMPQKAAAPTAHTDVKAATHT
jgi:hypothetical protein